MEILLTLLGMGIMIIVWIICVPIKELYSKCCASPSLSKWGDIEKVDISYKHTTCSDVYQLRRCENCGAIQKREIAKFYSY